jgi:hypothetical protein
MARRPRIISTLRARGGVIVPAMKWVLLVSLALAAIAMLWVFLGAPDAAPEAVPAVAGSR